LAVGRARRRNAMKPKSVVNGELVLMRGTKSGRP
jgi:hypothetical protein